MKDNFIDPYLSILTLSTIPSLLPNEQKRIVIPLAAGMEIKAAEHKLTIEIKEFFGFDFRVEIIRTKPRKSFYLMYV
ncbi:MAG: hypothetical protein WCP32_13065 [Bacteroidota bacterium]